jgi:NAD+ kinase
MKRAGILYQPRRSESCELTERVEALLRTRGWQSWRGTVSDERSLRNQAGQLDILITLGGDGTIVRAVRALAETNVPVLGVNLGRLGFLAELEPGEIETGIERVCQGDFTVEQRLMLRTWVWRGDQLLLEAEAINDVVVARGLVSRVVHLSVEVDGRHVMTPAADGVIISTPTGSTAYCLAAGGPIVAPDLRCLTLTPVAAHLGIAHALVIPAERRLCLRLVRGVSAMITVDGQVDLSLEPGDRVESTASEHTAKFVRFGGPGYFYETVLRRLRWPDRSPTP